MRHYHILFKSGGIIRDRWMVAIAHDLITQFETETDLDPDTSVLTPKTPQATVEIPSISF